jgi:hypothetical protein
MKKRKQQRDSLSQRLVQLIFEPDFIRFENALNEPNIFKIVGRTHYERWHSCFWGWLLDPNGTHLLNHYILVKLLILPRVIRQKIISPERVEYETIWRIYEFFGIISTYEGDISPYKETASLCDGAIS